MSGFEEVIKRSMADEGYRAQVMSNPHEALAAAGFNVPSEVKISVTEQKPGELHLVLPSKSADGDSPIGDEALETVSGGFCSCCCSEAAGKWPWD